VAECQTDLRLIKDVWDMSALVEQQFVSWRQTLWADIRTEIMEDGTKAFQKEARR